MFKPCKEEKNKNKNMLPPFSIPDVGNMHICSPGPSLEN
jgi:hypothetical protein